MNAIILTVGDEILLGQTVDTNSGWLGQALSQIGIRVIGHVGCGDEHDRIVRSLRQCWEEADLVIMTGGLGPTKDDITKKAIADFFGVEMVFDEGTWFRISRIFEKRGRMVTEGHRMQCFMPANAELLHNSMGTAPGMWFAADHKILISLPGVPYEMKAIMEEEGLPRLSRQGNGRPIFHRTLLTAGIGESELSQRLTQFESELPPYIRLAYLPSPGQVRLRLSTYGEDLKDNHLELEDQVVRLQLTLGHDIFAEGDTLLEAELGRLLKAEGKKLATAESCTGGYIAHRITAIPGASEWYQGTVIPYHNDLKEKILQVPHSDLEAHGAVSETVVLAMAKQVLDVMDADVAIAASGIAGPTGGTPAKPVGTVWVAYGSREDMRAVRLHLGKDRLKNIEMTAVFAINYLRLWLLEKH